MSTPDPLAAASSGAPLTVRKRRPLPGGRAVVGGLLVAVALVGTLAAYSGADDAPADTVVVLQTSVASGQRLTRADLRAEPAELPDEALGRSFRSVDDVEESVALAPMARGEVVQRSAVLLPDENALSSESSHEFSLPVDRDRAMNGQLERGETIDVLATYGSGDLAYTTVVARRARLIDVTDTSGGLGSDGRVVLTIALTSADEVMSAAHASAAATVTIVRSTRAGDQAGPDRYSPTTVPAVSSR